MPALVVARLSSALLRSRGFTYRTTASSRSVSPFCQKDSGANRQLSHLRDQDGMTHTSFTLSTVAANCSPKVECLASWRHLLLVGCADGTLQVYQTATDGSALFNLIKTIPKFSKSKKPILQLLVVEKWSILLCLSDAYVSIHDLVTFQHIEKLRTTKYCSTFCVHEDEGMLCAAASKSLILLRWTGKCFEDYNELHLPSTARSITFVTPSLLCVGFKREYNLLDIESGDVQRELIATGKSEKPMVTRIDASLEWSGSTPSSSNGGEVLVSKDSWGIFFHPDGKPSRNTSEFVQWTGCPLACISAFPFLVSITSDSIEVHHAGTLKIAQILSLNHPKSLILSASPLHNVKNAPLPSVFVATPNSVHVLTMVPLDEQLTCLEDQMNYPEAISLCTLCQQRLISVEYGGDTRRYQRRLQTLRLHFVYFLFDNQDYSTAFSHCKAGIVDPMNIMGLFPGLLPEGIHAIPERPPAKDGASAESGNGGVAGFVGLDKSAISSLLVPYLVYLRHNWGNSSVTGDSFYFSNNFAMDRKIERRGTDVSLREVVDTCLLSAYIRTNVDASVVHRFLLGEVAMDCDCLVDEMEALLIDMPTKWESLVWLYFSKGFHQRALDWLSASHGEKIKPPYPSLEKRIVKMTEYLHKLMCNIAKVVMEKRGGALQSNRQVSKTAAYASLEPQRVHGLLVMEYFQWIFRHNPVMSMKLFASFDLAKELTLEGNYSPGSPHSQKDKMQLEVERLLCFFNVIDPLSIFEHIQAQLELESDDDGRVSLKDETKASHQNSFCLQYLEFILLEFPDLCKQVSMEANATPGSLDSAYNESNAAANKREWEVIGTHLLQNEALHDHLILLYLDAILFAREKSRAALPASSTGSGSGPPTRSSKEPGKSGDLRRRLLKFLRISKFYRPESVLTKFQSTNMLEERALLLRAAGRHEDALHIYVHELGDLEFAASYCEEVFQIAEDERKEIKGSRSVDGVVRDSGGRQHLLKRSDSSNVYVKLLRTCLTPASQPPGGVGGQKTVGWAGGRNAALVKPALKILRSHSKRIDVVEAMKMLPDSAPISELSGYLAEQLRKNSSKKRSNQIVKNLLKLEQLNAMAETAKLKAQSVVIDRDTRCKKCGHTFTARSVPAVYPDLTVYHVACSVESEEY